MFVAEIVLYVVDLILILLAYMYIYILSYSNSLTPVKHLLLHLASFAGAFVVIYLATGVFLSALATADVMNGTFNGNIAIFVDSLHLYKISY